MPRPVEDFLSGAFGPLSPLRPMPIDGAQDESERPLPRRWQYPVGWNLPVGQPGAEGLKLATFPTLRRLADTYSVVRAMLNIRTNEMAGMTWDVGPTSDAQDKTKKDKGAKSDQKERAGQIVKWFNKVDSNYKGFLSWFQAALEDQYVIDAVSIHMLPPRVKGKGLFGSDLAQLELLNGETIRPLLDVRGATPRPPAPAYQQYLWGVPRADLMDVITGRDLDEMADRLENAGEPDVTDPDEEYAADQLLYIPRLRRSWTPYGFSSIEQAILPISIGLQRQGFLLDYFTEGTIPGVYVIAGDQYVTPAQQRQLQDTLNALAGDVAWKHRVIVLPPGSKTDPQKDMAWQEKVDNSIVEQVGMILHIQPHEVGMVPGGRTSGLGGKGMTEAQQDAVMEQRTEPDRKWWKETLFDWIIQEVFHQDDLEWKWLDFEEQEDEAQKSDAQQKYIQMGKTTIDEERIEDGLDPFNLPLTSTPWVIGGPSGLIPLDPTVEPPAAPAPPGGAIDPATGQPLPAPKPSPFGAKPGGAKPGAPPVAGAKPNPFGAKPAAGPPGAAKPGFPPKAAPAAGAPGPARPASPPFAKKGFGQSAQSGEEEVGPMNPDGTPITYPDGTPAVFAPDGTIAEPPDGILFTDDEIDGLLDVTDEEVGSLLDEQDDVPEPIVDTEKEPAKKVAAMAATAATERKKPEFRPIHGALNPAYTTAATHDDVHKEVGAIRTRTEARTGAPVTATPIVAAFERNLGRKVRAAIVALAVKKYGRIPSREAADATYEQWATRWLDKFLEAARRELRAHDHAAHATGLAHEKHLAQMHVDQIARGQEQRSGLDQRDPEKPDRRSKKYAVKYNRREPGVKDRRQADRRSATAAQKYEAGPDAIVPVVAYWSGQTVADLVKGKIKYKGDLTGIVYRYLLRSYPPDTIDWVNDKGGEWEYDPKVDLKNINMARRPGGRDPEKVKAISATLKDGASLDPIVLVDTGNPAGLEIADGWHRTLGAADAGHDTVPAFVGTGFPKDEGLKAPWGTEMQDASDSKKRAAVNELAVLRRFLRKGGLVENFRTDAIPAEVLDALAEEAGKMERDAAFDRARLRLEGVVFKYSDDEARDDHGRWTAGSASDVAQKLADGRSPEIQPGEVKDVLAACATRPDNPDLTELRVAGTLMFGGNGLGLTRDQMPQLPLEQRPAFLASLAGRGITVTNEQVNPHDLHPIQKEISAKVVGQALPWWREGSYRDSIISKDNYIIDGHHGWGCAVALRFERPGFEMPVIRVGEDHTQLMKDAEAWDQTHNIEHLALGGGANIRGKIDEAKAFPSAEKDFSLTAPLATGFAPFGLDQAPSLGSCTCPENATDADCPVHGDARSAEARPKVMTPDLALLEAIDQELRRRGVDPTTAYPGAALHSEPAPNPSRADQSGPYQTPVSKHSAPEEI